MNKESYQRNRDSVLQKQKAYYEKNREKIQEKRRIKLEASGKAIKVGDSFYKLTVISQSQSAIQGSSHRRMWMVRCECGDEFETAGTKLRRGDIVMCRSCASKLRPQSAIQFTGAEILFKRVILNRANKVGIPVDMNADEFVDLATQDCHYCGAPPSKRDYHGKRKIDISINGLDRVDSALGYSVANCVPCCSVCNIMKNALSVGDFMSHVKQIVSHMEARK